MSQQTTYLKPGALDIIQSIFILLIQMVACYFFIYSLLPRYFSKSKYLLLPLYALFLCLSVAALTFLMNSVIAPFIETVFTNPTAPTPGKPLWSSIFYGGINLLEITAVATSIKIAKSWWFKEQERLHLEKEKVNAELHLLKGQIHPEFLLKTLNNIYSSSLIASPKAPEMLMKLSEILSYMLYECNDSEVFLEKEIKMLQDYMILEKSKFGDRLEMSILVKGCNATQKIAPLLFFHFIENSFKESSSTLNEQPWINLEIQIENNNLDMKLMNGKSIIPLAESGEVDKFDQTRRRLQLLYPRRHTIKITEEPEILMVNLTIELNEVKEYAEAL